MRTSTNHTKPEVNVRGNLKGMEEKKTERMTVPATDAEKTGQEVKKPVKVAKKEEKIFVEFGGRQILVNDVAESAKADYKALFEKENVDAYYLEFDDERSGGFEPLEHVNGDKKVVLGLITTKSPKLENKADVIARIKEAQKYISLDRLCLSPQCGFASCEIGNKLTEEEQWAKLQLVKEIAEEVWR